MTLCISFLRVQTHCTTLHHTAPHCNTRQHTATLGNTRQHTATHCIILQHTAPHCTTLHHTATHCNTGVDDVGHVAVSDAAALCVSKGPSFRDAPARSTHVTPCHALSVWGYLKCVVVFYSVLQRVAVCCSVLQCVVV